MSGTPRCCNTLRSTPLGNLDPVIRLFEGIFLTASANLIRNRGFHVDYLGHAHGQIIPCAVGWVIVYKQPLGLWTEVAGPFSTREKARHAQKEAWDNYCQHTHARQGGKG